MKISIAQKDRLPTLTLYIGFIAMAFFTGCVGASLPGLADNTASSLDEISILFSALFLGYVIGSFLSGKIHDRFNPFRVLAVSLLIGAIALVIIPVVNQRWVLAGVVLVMGLAQGSIDLGTNTTLIWIHGEKSTPFLNGLHASFGLGAFLTPLLFGKITALTENIRWAYWSLALIVFPIAILFFLLPASIPPASKIPAQTDRAGRQQSIPFLLILLFALILFTVIGSGNSFSGWVLTYTQSTFPDLPAQTAYQVSATFWIAIALTRVLSIPVISRIPSKLILLVDIVGTGLSFVLMLLFRHSLLAVWLTVASAGMFVATVFAVILVYCNRVCGMKGSSTRWLYLGAGLGNICVPWLVGQFFENRGPAWMHIVHISLISLGLLLLFVLSRTIRQQTLASGVIDET